jgi:gamma-glutamyltranspeptidase / glutathione hydrolase
MAEQTTVPPRQFLDHLLVYFTSDAIIANSPPGYLDQAFNGHRLSRSLQLNAGNEARMVGVRRHSSVRQVRRAVVFPDVNQLEFSTSVHHTARMRALALVALIAVPSLAARPYRGGVVAAAHPLGSAAGNEMLAQGGNAIDAVVAAALTMGVVGPYHSGLGGGGFAVIKVPQGEFAFDFREVAPAGASHDMFLKDGVLVPGLSTDGALSVAVPAAVKGYLELHAKYGKLPRATVLTPAIRAATKGFPVTPKYQSLAALRESCLRKDPEAARIFLRPNVDGVASVPTIGTIITQPDLAKTLQSLSARGSIAFYEGPIAKAIATTIKTNGGVLTEADLKAYRARWRAPLEGSYRGHRIITMPPPSGGGITLLQVLGVLEAKGSKGPATREVDTLHTFIEALRRAAVDRARFVGDPDVQTVPTIDLTSKAWVDKTLSSIDPKRATRSNTILPPELKKPTGPLDGGLKPQNTTHISVIDADGNAAALTTTVNYAFGSCLVAKGTGVLLNDEMDDFAAQPGTPNAYGLVTGEANAVAPGKIPLSSMTPTLVFMKEAPKDVLLAVGSPGGSTIPTTVLQVISNVIDGSLDPVRAVGNGRIHHQWLPDEVMVDKTGLEPATISALEAMGHLFKRVDGWGDAEAVFVDPVTKLRFGASDPRNEGAPTGQD